MADFSDKVKNAISKMIAEDLDKKLLDINKEQKKQQAMDDKSGKWIEGVFVGESPLIITNK